MCGLIIGICIAIVVVYESNHISKHIVFSNEWKSIPTLRARPDRIYLSYISTKNIPAYVWNQYQKYARGFTIEFFDDIQCFKSIQSFGKKVVDCYQSLSDGAHRCDLWRYCMLYRTGGVYLDIKTILTRPVSEMFPRRDCMYTVLGKNKEKIHQGIMAVPPEHPIIADAITNMLHNPPGNDRLHVCGQLYHLIENYTSQTPRVGINPTSAGLLELYQEQVTHNCDVRDRYGLCQMDVLNASGEQMCIIRDPAFPYKVLEGTYVPSWISLPEYYVT